nr:Chain C, VQIIYK peptide [Homo sapiens]
VQIIYK